MRAKLLIDISETWKKDTEVFLNGIHFCTIDGSCLEASLIYENPEVWETYED